MKQNSLIDVLALSFVSGAALLLLNLQPLFIGSIATSFDLNATELGYFASAPLSASFFVFVTAPIWLKLASLRRLIYLGGAAASLALICMMNADGILSLTVFFALHTAAVSIIQVPVLVALGRMPDEAAAFGIFIAIGVILAGAYAFLVPVLIEPNFGFAGILAAILVTTVIATALVHFAQRSSLEREDGSSAAPRTRWNDINRPLALFSLALFYMGAMGAWVFLERVGTDAGLSDRALGAGFALGLLASGLAPIAAGYLGDRISIKFSFSLSSIMLLLFGALLLIGETGPYRFGIGLVLFLNAWNFGISYMLVVAGRADESGSTLSLAPAAMALGSTLGPAASGNVMAEHGKPGLLTACMVTLLLSFLIMNWVHQKTLPKIPR